MRGTRANVMARTPGVDHALLELRAVHLAGQKVRGASAGRARGRAASLRQRGVPAMLRERAQLSGRRPERRRVDDRARLVTIDATRPQR